MSAKANYFKLGLFIISGVIIAVGLVLALGAGALFRDKVTVETYLDESVQGLEVGSKVKYRGVVVGHVSEIGFTASEYEQDKPPDARHRYVLVEGVLYPSLIGITKEDSDTAERDLGVEVERGLRVRITSQGITGTSYLEIDYLDPKSNPPLPIDWKPEHYYIPSAPSTVSRIVSATEELAKRLHGLDMEGLTRNANTLMVTLTKTLDELPIDKIGKDATDLIADVQQANQQLQKSLTQIQKTLRRVDRLVGGSDSDVGVTLDNLRQTAENLRELTESAKRYPSQVIFGEPPRHSPEIK